jgi:uncharacterized protein YndB with AHSA1/START domain
VIDPKAPAPSRSIELRRTFPAPPDRVFAAWTRPELIKKWWGVADGYTTPLAEIDLQVGGRYRLGMLPPDQDDLILISGEYRVIDPPDRLVFSWEVESKLGPGMVSMITLWFIRQGRSTELVLIHDFIGPEQQEAEFRAGWEGMLVRLGAELSQ